MEEIMHSKGAWKNHSYIRKIKKNGRWVYVYSSDNMSTSNHGLTSRKKRIASGSASVVRREKVGSSSSTHGLVSREKRIAEGSASVVRRKKVSSSSSQTKSLGKNTVSSLLQKLGNKTLSETASSRKKVRF